MATGRFAEDPLRAAVCHPGLVWSYLHQRSVLSRLGLTGKTRRRYMVDLIDRDGLPQRLRAIGERTHHAPLLMYSGGETIGTQNEFLYLLVRHFRPRIIVETGVAAGFSTAYILQGLQDNEEGTLHSVDLPTRNPAGRINLDGVREAVHVDSGDATGEVIPKELRNRWRLHLGESSSVLPRLMTDLSAIDMFWHDSEHSYANMTMEYRVAWPRLVPGGFLLSDDIHLTTAFWDFGRTARVQPIIFSAHRGGYRKELLHDHDPGNTGQ